MEDDDLIALLQGPSSVKDEFAAIHIHARDARLAAARIAALLGEWRGIAEPPAQPMAVILYFANGTLRTVDENPPSEFPEYRQIRATVGYFDGQDWRDNSSGHDLFEDWNYPDWTPTHWKPLGPLPLRGDAARTGDT